MKIKYLVTGITILMLHSCGGGSSSTPEIQLTESTSNTNPPIFNIDAAFNYALQDGMFTQQVSIYANEVFSSRWRDISVSEEAKISNFGFSGIIENFKGNREFEDLTSWSTGKSFLSILIGIAEDKELLTLTDSAAKYLSEWSGDEKKEAITIKDLLNMRSGLAIPDGDSGGNITVHDNQFSFCLELDSAHEPDDYFQYNNCNSMLLGKVLERASGQDFEFFAQSNLFNKLNIKATWWKDIAGNYLTYCCVDMSQKDFVRFGQMLLNMGEGVVSESYINKIFSGYESYSLHFWLRDDTLQTIGFDGQCIAIDFINNLIAARNSLYHAATDGSYTMSIKGSIEDYQLPITLPRIVTGEASPFDMSEFLRILKTP